MRMLVTGSSNSRIGSQFGFTLLEVVIAISIGALLVAISVPAAVKMYQSMEYRSAIRDARNTLEAARLESLNSGHFVDVLIAPRDKKLLIEGKRAVHIPSILSVSVTSAKQLQRDRNTAVIRFYPDGASSGGRIDITRGPGDGASMEVGWLVGEVKLHALKQ